MQNPYFNQQLAQAHRQTLLQEAQQEQVLAQLPPSHQSMVHSLIARLTILPQALVGRRKNLRAMNGALRRALRAEH